jgi:CheY-like chemotaxis protein
MSISGFQEGAGSAHILLVNSNRSGLAARKAILEEAGHRVTTAASGEDAWEHLSKARFDLIVTEYKMGKMNGVELIKKMRGIEPAIPVIMLSGYVEALGLTESTTGADVVLAKSANEVTDLIRAVSRLLRQKVKKPAGSKARAASQAGRQAS